MDTAEKNKDSKFDDCDALANIPIFISSSDNTFDVFSVISKSIIRAYANNRCKLYVGLNQKCAPEPFTSVAAPLGGWRQELYYQLNSLPEEYDYVILLLDDFFIHEPMELGVLDELIDSARRRDIDYVRLKPLERSWFISAFRYISGHFESQMLEKIKKNEPYYSSLQAAIWKRSYLLRMLEQNGSIWDFEHLVLAGSKHYAVRRSYGFKYEHLVEKGRWLRHAPKLLSEVPLEQFQMRGFDQRRIYRYAALRKMKFAIYGFLIFKFRRALQVAFRSKI